MKAIIRMLALAFAASLALPASAEEATGKGAPSPCDSAEDSPCAKCRPVWPQASLRNEEQGTTILALLIDVDGRAIDAKIVKTSGYHKLDAAARTALLQCPYKPATVDGKPVQGWIQMTQVWTLQ